MVLPSPNHGTVQAKPTLGAKFFHSVGKACFFGLGVLGPTNSLAVNRLGSHVDAGMPFGLAVPLVQARADVAVALEP